MSPYSGKPPTVQPGTRLAWARLNADALFLALLAAGAGIFGILDPAGDDLVHLLDGTTPSYYLQQAMYLLGGLGIIYALTHESVTVEVLSRISIAWAACFELFRTVRAFGIDSHLLEPIVLVAIILFTGGLRLSVLLSKKGLVVRLPERSSEDES